MTKQDIIALIEKDQWMMDVLQAVKSLNLSDWLIGAGFVRSKVWDYLHGYTQRTPLPDIDVIYFDRFDFTKEEEKKNSTAAEKQYESILTQQKKDIRWSVTNQTRMHIFHNDKPYRNSEDALAQWVETATCIGARLDKDNRVILTTPRGISDLVNLYLRRTPRTDEKIFIRRVREKQWLKKWPKLRIV